MTRAGRLAGWVVGAVAAIAATGCSPDDGYVPKSTDILLSAISVEEAVPRLGDPRNLTDRDGYDNQPTFTPDSQKLLYASSRDGGVDIFSYELATGASVRLTDSDEREYSPSPVPGFAGFSSVRVESDGSQRLWHFDPEGKDPVLLLEWEDDVGYYAWIDSDVVALRVDDDPSELRFADVDVGWVEREPVMTHIGRSLHRVPGKNAISFVHMDPEGEWWITELDLMLREPSLLVETLPGSEDYAWLPTGGLLMAQDSKVFFWSQQTGKDWIEVADFAGQGVQNITRLAVSPDGTQLAMVADRVDP